MTKEMESEIEKLARRCEEATSPSRELDVAIWLVAVADQAALDTIKIGREVIGDREAEFRTSRLMDGFRPTASLDAAMTLVPERHAVDLTMWGPLWEGKHRARIFPLVKDGDRWLHRGCDTHYCTNAASPALALCAAALRARSLTPRSSGVE